MNVIDKIKEERNRIDNLIIKKIKNYRLHVSKEFDDNSIQSIIYTNLYANLNHNLYIDLLIDRLFELGVIKEESNKEITFNDLEKLKHNIFDIIEKSYDNIEKEIKYFMPLTGFRSLVALKYNINYLFNKLESKNNEQ